MNPEGFRRIICNTHTFSDKKNAIYSNHWYQTSRPEAGYGYVEAKDAVEGEICSVDAFKEKPNDETAEKYLETGNYLWCAGIFAWDIKTITDCITKQNPNTATNMDKIYATSNMAEISPQCEKISIDCAVKKPASEDNFVYTHPTGFGWSDLGNQVRCMISYKKMIITTELLVISNYMNVTTV